MPGSGARDYTEAGRQRKQPFRECKRSKHGPGTAVIRPGNGEAADDSRSTAAYAV